PNDTVAATNGIKQTRRRLGQNLKSSSTTTKRLRTPRSIIKSSRVLTTTEQQQQLQQQQQQDSTTSQNPLPDLSSAPIYDTQQWTTHLDSDTSVNHLYEQDLYSTSVNTPLANNNSISGIQSTYLFDDIATNYVSNTSSNPTNASDYSYHHHHHQPQHFHHQQPQTLYQHHHGSNYDISSNNGYYHQQPVLNEHHLLPMDAYHTNNGLSYPLQQQQQ
ncbi:unnamed protein product, partial [Rotaria magnacalcarata]